MEKKLFFFKKKKNSCLWNFLIFCFNLEYLHSGSFLIPKGLISKKARLPAYKHTILSTFPQEKHLLFLYTYTILIRSCSPYVCVYVCSLPYLLYALVDYSCIRRQLYYTNWTFFFSVILHHHLTKSSQTFLKRTNNEYFCYSGSHSCLKNLTLLLSSLETL